MGEHEEATDIRSGRDAVRLVRRDPPLLQEDRGGVRQDGHPRRGAEDRPGGAVRREHEEDRRNPRREAHGRSEILRIRFRQGGLRHGERVPGDRGGARGAPFRRIRNVRGHPHGRGVLRTCPGEARHTPVLRPRQQRQHQGPGDQGGAHQKMPRGHGRRAGGRRYNRRQPGRPQRGRSRRRRVPRSHLRI